MAQVPEATTVLPAPETTTAPVPVTNLAPAPVLMTPIETSSATPTPARHTPVRPFPLNIDVDQGQTVQIDDSHDKGQHDLKSFREVLLKAISPREKREKPTKKKISFNNMAVTEEDVMEQILELEKDREDKEKKKQERKKIKEEKDLKKRRPEQNYSQDKDRPTKEEEGRKPKKMFYQQKKAPFGRLSVFFI